MGRIRVEPVARIEVGALDGSVEEEFDEVTTPFLLPSGRLVVPSAGHGEIRIFDETGTLVQKYGGSGDGPGEFRRLAGVWSRADTLEALDLGLRRITRFLPAGGSR